MSKETVEKGIVLMLVAGTIGHLAIRLVRLSQAIFSAVFELARDLRKQRQWKRADCSSFLCT
jgi:hypothetical protein